MKTHNIWILLIIAAIAAPLSGQDCFTRYFEEGNRQMAEPNYEKAIVNYLGTLNCPEATLEQRQKAGSQLDLAINRSRQVLMSALSGAEEARDKAVLEAQRASMRYLAYLAQRELELGNAENGLILAFQALDLSRQLGEQDSEIENLFGQAVWASRSRKVAKAGMPPVFGGQGKLLVADNDVIRLYDTKKNTEQVVEGLPDGEVLKIAGAAGVPYFLAFFEGATPLVLNEEGKVAARLAGLNTAPTSIAFSTDGRMAATGLEDGRVLVWHLPEGRLEATLADGTDKVLEVRFSADGRRLLSRLARAAYLWDVGGQSLIAKLALHNTYLYQASFLNEDKNLLTFGADGQSILWDGQGNKLKELGANNQLAVIAPGQRLIMLIDDQQRATAWNGKGEKVHAFHAPPTRKAAFSYNAQHLLLWTGQKANLLGEYGKTLFTLSFPSQVNDADFAPDDTHFLVGTEDGQLSLWNKSKALVLETQTGNNLKTVAFSPQGDALLAYSYSGGAWLCPLPVRVYRQMVDSPPPLNAELLEKYGL